MSSVFNQFWYVIDRHWNLCQRLPRLKRSERSALKLDQIHEAFQKINPKCPDGNSVNSIKLTGRWTLRARRCSGEGSVEK